MTLTDATAARPRLVAATVADAPADLGMHLVLVKEIGKITIDPPAQKVAKAARAEPRARVPSRPRRPHPRPAPGGRCPARTAGTPDMSGWPAGCLPGRARRLPGARATRRAGLPRGPGYRGARMPGSAPGGAATRPTSARSRSTSWAAVPARGGGGSIDLLYGVNLEVTVEIGRTRLPIRDVLALTPGSIVELDKLAGEKVDVLVNGHLIASGEVVVVEENFGVRITDVSARARRLAMGEGAA